MPIASSCGSASVEAAVHVVEQDQLAHPEHLDRRAQLGFTDPGQRLRPGMTRIALRDPAESSALAAGRGEHERLDALGRVARDRAAETERFVVGMGQHRQEPERRGHCFAAGVPDPPVGAGGGPTSGSGMSASTHASTAIAATFLRSSTGSTLSSMSAFV